MTPRLESVWFGRGQYPRMARVLDFTARRYNPDWSIRVREIPEGNLRGDSAGYTSNSWKLGAWTDLVISAADGERLLLIDADTFILGPLDGLWEGDFDVKITVRPAGSRFPINGGVVAVNAGARARDFFTTWLTEDRRLLRDPVAHQPWRQVYGGMNQSSLGSILSRGPAARVLEAPCRVWNCEDATWKDFDPELTRVVHVKSGLRMTVFGIGPSNLPVKHLATLWRRLETEALQSGLTRL